jgi:tetratricopeptide (TPR) repeat protein
MRRLLIILFVTCIGVAVAGAQETATPTPAPLPTPAVEPSAFTLEEVQALVDEARVHAEDANRYATDASNFLIIFEALGFIVTVGGIAFAVIGVQRLFSAENELQKTREKFESELATKERELDMLKTSLSESAERQRRESEETTTRAILALSLLPLGERQYRAQDFDGAMKTYERALELDDMNPVTHLRLGYVSTQSGKLEEARHHLKRALEIEQSFAPAMAALGYVYRRIGEKMDEGIERDEMLNQGEGMLLQALRISPSLVDDDGESWWGSLGGLYRRRGQVEQAITAYERAAKVTPHSSYPFSNLALLYMQTDNRAKMLETYKRVERLARGETQAEVDNYWAYADLLTSQLALGKTKEADDSLQSVIDLAPVESPYVLNMLIDTLERLAGAMGGMDAMPHIKPFVAKLREVQEGRGSPTS